MLKNIASFINKMTHYGVMHEAEKGPL